MKRKELETVTSDKENKKERVEIDLNNDLLTQHVYDLLTVGYCVVDTGYNRSKLTNEFESTLKSFPAFKPDAQKYVGGGFSALANSGSFHNPFVRRLRMELVGTYGKSLATAFGKNKVEVLVDRMLYRPTTEKVTVESWHRDEAPRRTPIDNSVVLGGWLNCGEANNEFICVPKSQLDQTKMTQKGFGGFHQLDKVNFPTYKAKEVRVQVPPGHMLVFNETIIHRVANNKLNKPVSRLFLGWRLTEEEEPLIQNIQQLLINQRIVPLKSGQIPRMWPKLWWVNWKPKLTEFTEKNIKDEYKETSNNFTYCKLFLEEGAYNPSYTAEELAIYVPH